MTAAGWDFTVSGDVITIVISSKVTLILTKGRAGYNNLTFTVVINGTSTQLRTVPRSFTMVSCKSDNVAFLQLYNGNDGNRTHFIWEKIGTKELCGYGGDTGASYVPINNINFNDVDNSTVYNHGALLNYAAESGLIDFAANDCLFISGVKSLNDPNFKACSTMTANTVITVQGKNCFVIGAHSLFEYDS